MQCTMQLETAYTFHITCMETEEKFREQLSQRSGTSKEEEKKKIEMMCKTCNITFSARKIFDLHNRVMHNQSPSEDEDIIGFKKSRKGKRDKFQMVFVEDNKKTSPDESFEGNTSKNEEMPSERRSKRRTLPRNNYTEINDSFGYDSYEDFPVDALFTEIGVRKSKKRKRANNENEDIKPDIEEVPVEVCDNREESKIDKSPKGSEKLLNCRFCGRKLLEKNLMTHIARSHKERCSRCLLCKRYRYFIIFRMLVIFFFIVQSYSCIKMLFSPFKTFWISICFKCSVM